MDEVVLFCVQLVLQILLPWWIVRRDLSRLSPRQVARTWNDASFWSAIVVFGLLAIPVHFSKSRRSLGGLVVGVLWMMAALVVLVVTSEALGSLMGLG